MGIDQLLGMATILMARDMEDVKRFHARPLLSIPTDYPEGPIAYLDYIIAKKWDLTMRKMIGDLIILKFPHVQRGVWYRPGKHQDRLYTYFRKGAEQS